ncbi:hypothetical protein GOP47_0016582 [Adiantum capillus-veneris]|uniref:Peptide transporter n=1 Tax=Adiantum capillus-veneris TaxID=13818 RepID=A0A9D4UIC7_ADICA|nr:hypothetical protein GOP47_0016582 [Adiantum capillus-veneris]
MAATSPELGKEAKDVEEQVPLFAQDGSVNIKGQPVLKSKTGNWKACPFILGNETSERLAYYGINTNLVTFLTKKLNQSNARASVNVTNWSGTCYITPLIGAFLADAYLGRYWTIAVFSAIYFVGMVLLTLTTAVPSLVPPKYGSATMGQLAAFYLSLYLIALGTGGIKPCVSSFGADQFDENDEREKKNKVSFFNWFYFSVNIGALIASSVLVYIQDNVSWTWGFGVPAAMMGVAIISFFSGTPLYRHQKPGGSPLTRIAQVLTASFSKRRVAPSSDPNLLYETTDCSIQGSRKLEHTNFFCFLDKAATRIEGEKGNPSAWKLCTVTQVEEVKTIVRLLPIWATGIVFSTVYSQMSTLFVEQGQGMNRSIGRLTVGAASFSLFDTLSVIIWVPVYDRLIVPIVRHYSGDVRGFTQLQRMGIGLLISITSMIAAAIVEIKRLAMARELQLLDPSVNTPIVPISAFWQVPQYFLVGAAEVFTFVGQIEFFYDQAPDAMRSLCSALSLTTVALGNYLSSLLVTVITKITGKPGWIPANNLNIGHLDYFFWLLAVLSFLNLLCYLGCSHWYTYKKPHAEKEGGVGISMVPGKEGSQKQG